MKGTNTRKCDRQRDFLSKLLPRCFLCTSNLKIQAQKLFKIYSKKFCVMEERKNRRTDRYKPVYHPAPPPPPVFFFFFKSGGIIIYLAGLSIQLLKLITYIHIYFAAIKKIFIASVNFASLIFNSSGKTKIFIFYVDSFSGRKHILMHSELIWPIS